MDWLADTLLRIIAGTLLPAPYYEGLDCDSALDGRDRDVAFDGEWMRVSAMVEQSWHDRSVDEEACALVEDIRRESFLAVSRATLQHEIASYVSEDFELMMRGRLLGIDDRFLTQLWLAYERGEFPRPVPRDYSAS